MTDKLRYEVGDEIQVSVLLRDMDGRPVHGAECAVAARVGRRLPGQLALAEDTREPGVYRGVLKDVPPGTVTIRAAGPGVEALLDAEAHSEPVTIAVTVSPPGALELRHTRCNLPLLKQLAESSGGRLIGPTALESTLSLSDLSPEVTETVTQRPLWVRWPFLWVFLACLTVEWAVRKLYGLA
jgi:hypothetical protein